MRLQVGQTGLWLQKPHSTTSACLEYSTCSMPSLPISLVNVAESSFRVRTILQSGQLGEPADCSSLRILPYCCYHALPSATGLRCQDMLTIHMLHTTVAAYSSNHQTAASFHMSTAERHPKSPIAHFNWPSLEVSQPCCKICPAPPGVLYVHMAALRWV